MYKRIHRNRATILVLLIAISVALSSCGGGSSSGSSTNSTKSALATEPSKEFVGKGPNGKLAEDGKESSIAEREAASLLIEQMERAREHRDWAGQCRTLVAPYVRQFAEKAPKGGPKTCAAGVKAFAKGVKQRVLDSTMVGPIAALRVTGKRAYAFYHGTHGKKYVIPLEKERGEWKLAAVGEFEDF